MNLATFRIEFPEFQSATDALVSALLARALLEVDAGGYGQRYDHAHGLLAAHYISCSPGGQMARLETDKAETTYGKAYLRLQKSAAALVRVF